MKELLKELTETHGVSGEESQIRQTIREKVEDHADSIEEDNLGNLIVRKGSGDKTLMISSHMDQIGLTVKNISENGFIDFSKVGGIPEQAVLNQRVNIHTSEGQVKGVIGMKPIHLMEKEERDKVPETDKLFIDIGAEDGEAVEEAGVKVGDYISIDRDLAELQDDVLTSLAFDNRVGCAIAIEALKEFDEDYELAVVFSTQEEVGLKGAQTSAFQIDPDVALAIDVSVAGGVPGVEEQESSLEMGEGLEITFFQSEGRGLVTPQTVRDWLVETAEENDNDYQRGVWSGGATDAAKIYLVREGIPTGSIGLPVRNMHTSVETVKVSDVEETVDFVTNAFESMEDYF